jgi:ABC-type protease/lipase transport system fused ATPase/permease subunit
LSFIVFFYALHKSIRDFYLVSKANNFDSGLQIQNYQNATHPNHTVIAIAGTNGLNDWDDNVSFITGGLSEQFQQALTYAEDLVFLTCHNGTRTWGIQSNAI